MDLFLVLYTVILFSLKQSLTRFRDKPLTNLYSSVARSCIFLWCTETKLSIFQRSVKEDVLLLYIIRKHLISSGFQNSIYNLYQFLIVFRNRCFYFVMCLYLHAHFHQNLSVNDVCLHFLSIRFQETIKTGLMTHSLSRSKLPQHFPKNVFLKINMNIQAKYQADNIWVDNTKRTKPKENQLGILWISSRKFTHFAGNLSRTLFLSFFENTPKKLLHFSQKSCHNFT